MSAKCVRTETNQVVGCGAAPQGGEFSRYCWRDASSKRNYLANLPLGSLASPGAGWESCDADLQAFVGSDQVLACSNDCERFSATSCTPEDTCAALACGSHSSPYRADGCKRAKGAPCQADTDCGQQELCGVLSVFAGVNCGYLADGTCNCAGVIDGAVGPTGVCVAQ